MQTKVAEGALIQLRAWLAQRDLPEDGRLPPERELIEILGVTRGELRKALAALENNGELWRHVGKGQPLDLGRGVELSHGLLDRCGEGLALGKFELGA